MTDSLWRKRQEPEALKRITRDDTEHDRHYYLADEVDALLAQPEQEAVAWLDEYGNTFPLAAKQYSVVGKHWKPLYTTPPQRKPLMDEMRKQMKERCDSMEMRGAFANGWISAEAAHNIKE